MWHFNPEKAKAFIHTVNNWMTRLDNIKLYLDRRIQRLKSDLLEFKLEIQAALEYNDNAEYRCRIDTCGELLQKMETRGCVTEYICMVCNEKYYRVAGSTVLTEREYKELAKEFNS